VGHEYGAALSVGTKVAEGVEVLCDEHHLHHLAAANVLHTVVEVLHRLPQPIDDRLHHANWLCMALEIPTAVRC
jgi:hypothetical protein